MVHSMGLAVCLLYGVKNARAAGSALEACERGETPPRGGPGT
jgi:hypothetical protein